VNEVAAIIKAGVTATAETKFVFRAFFRAFFVSKFEAWNVL
jgi:hypothetical protein